MSVFCDDSWKYSLTLHNYDKFFLTVASFIQNNNGFIILFPNYKDNIGNNLSNAEKCRK